MPKFKEINMKLNVQHEAVLSEYIKGLFRRAMAARMSQEMSAKNSLENRECDNNAGDKTES